MGANPVLGSFLDSSRSAQDSPSLGGGFRSLYVHPLLGMIAHFCSSAGNHSWLALNAWVWAVRAVQQGFPKRYKSLLYCLGISKTMLNPKDRNLTREMVLWFNMPLSPFSFRLTWTSGLGKLWTPYLLDSHNNTATSDPNS